MLKAVQGNIFQLDESIYDVVIAFVAGGFSGINTDFLINFENINKSLIPYIVYSDNQRGYLRNNSKFYKSRRELFDTEEEIALYIDSTVFQALDLAVTKGNRIAISGIWIRELDHVKNEKWMVEAINRWLIHHPDVEVTIVDIQDSIAKHNILL